MPTPSALPCQRTLKIGSGFFYSTPRSLVVTYNNSVLSTQYRVTQYRVSSSGYPVPSTQYRVLSYQYLVRSYSVLQYSLLATRYSLLGTQYSVHTHYSLLRRQRQAP